MSTFDDLPRLRYVAHSNAAAYERYTRKINRRRTREWLLYTASLIPMFCGFSYLSCFMATLFGASFPAKALFAAIACGIIASPLFVLIQYDAAIRQATRKRSNESWECELTDEYYQFVGKNGVLTAIPWRLMKIEAVDPDFWGVNCLDFQLMIFREPLRQAGLEQEFESRVGKDFRNPV